MIKVYLDDVREAPEGWVRTYTAKETIDFLRKNAVTHLSLDHDLGDETVVDCGNGYDVLLWIEETTVLTDYVPPTVIRVHSSNSSARIKMESAILFIRECYEKRGRK